MLRIKSILFRLSACCLTAAFLLTSCGKQDSSSDLLESALEAPKQGNYKTQTVQRGDFSFLNSWSAELYFPKKEALSAESDNSRLRQLLVKQGDEVKAGQLLAVVSADGSQADLEDKRFQIENAKEDMNKEKQNRLSQIHNEEAALAGLSGTDAQIKQLQIQSLQEAYHQYVYETEHNIALQEEELREAEKTMSQTEITAPFDGRVESVASFEVGDKIGKGDVLMTLYDESMFYLQVEDKEHKLYYNMDVTVEAGRRDETNTYTGKVVSAANSVSYKINDNIAYIALDGSVKAKDLQGMTLAVAAVTSDLQDVLLVDKKAVYSEDKKTYVYVLEGDSLRKRYVTIGERGNADVVWVTDGLEEGQIVVLD